MHIVLAESAAVIFEIKRIIKQFKKACASQIHRKFLIFEKICCTCFCFGHGYCLILTPIRTKIEAVACATAPFWWARVDCASRASEKAPQGLFPPPDYSAGRCCSNPPLKAKLQILCKTKIQCISTLDFLVGAGGFEPPKLKAADLQSVPIGHSGTRPYSFVRRPCRAT